MHPSYVIYILRRAEDQKIVNVSMTERTIKDAESEIEAGSLPG